MAFKTDLNLEATELRLGLPGSQEMEKQSTRINKRTLPDMNEDQPAASREGENCKILDATKSDQDTSHPSKAQVVGWPPIRAYRKNCFQPKKPEPEAAGIYVKVSMDGAPYLRKIDLNIYKGYPELLMALEDRFNFKVGQYSEREGYKGSEFLPTYEDKDGDWMLVGDVPWEMFITSCKKLRILKGSEARGLGCAV